jgi:hypothetical protein
MRTCAEESKELQSSRKVRKRILVRNFKVGTHVYITRP